MSHAQMTLALARAAGDAGMQAATEHAERVDPGWSDVALVFVAKWARERKQSDRFTAEAFVDDYVNDPNFVQPPDERAFGSVVKRAISKGLIAYSDSHGRRRKGHGSRCDRYRSLVAGQPWTAVRARLEL